MEARLDLHGMTQQEAHGALIRFITGSHLASRQVVLVITGKGRGGEGAGILRRAVPHWLAGRELSPIVASYGPAHQSHGGAGALYVRLRSPKRAGKGRPRP
ncbi:MAG: Smr/MutS family protein [Pseudomonadota bacterium]